MPSPPVLQESGAPSPVEQRESGAPWRPAHSASVAGRSRERAASCARHRSVGWERAAEAIPPRCPRCRVPGQPRRAEGRSSGAPPERSTAGPGQLQFPERSSSGSEAAPGGRPPRPVARSARGDSDAEQAGWVPCARRLLAPPTSRGSRPGSPAGVSTAVLRPMASAPAWVPAKRPVRAAVGRPSTVREWAHAAIPLRTRQAPPPSSRQARSTGARQVDPGRRTRTRAGSPARSR